MMLLQEYSYPQIVELYTINMFKFLHVNHTSIKWFKTEKFKHKFSQLVLYLEPHMANIKVSAGLHSFLEALELY